MLYDIYKVLGVFYLRCGTVPTVAIAASNQRFPVRRILAVGQTYAEHARAMGSAPDRHPPFFFTQPAYSMVSSGIHLRFPGKTTNRHPEGERVLGLGKAAGA